MGQNRASKHWASKNGPLLAGARCGRDVPVHMAPRNGPCKAQLAGFQRFPHDRAQFAGEITPNIPVVKHPFGQWPSWPAVPAAMAVFTYCCACSTALPLPGHFVRRSKLSLTGVLSWKDVALGGETERAVR